MKNLIIACLIICAPISAKEVNFEMIQKRYEEVSQKLHEKNEKNEIDDEYRWYQGYFCALLYVMGIDL